SLPDGRLSRAEIRRWHRPRRPVPIALELRFQDLRYLRRLSSDAALGLSLRAAPGSTAMPKVTAWVYFYAWPIDRTTFYRQGDWLATLESGVQARRFRGDRLPIARYRPVGWPNHPSPWRAR